MAKVLVTGGTGFVGREVVRQLHTLGYQVRVLCRPGGAGNRFLAKYGAEEAAGEVGDAVALDRAMRGIDAVVHLVGIIVEKRGQTFQKVHVEGTENVVRAAEKAGVKRFIHMSALGRRNQEGAFLTEYHRTKALAEQVVRGSSLDWTIFRPSVIFGPGDGFVNQLAAMMRFPWTVLQLWSFPLIGGGKTLLQPVSAGDVGRAFAGSIAHADAVGQTYDLVGAERLSLREILQEIATATGHEVVVEKFPWLLLGRSVLWALVAAIPVVLLVLALLPAILAWRSGGGLADAYGGTWGMIEIKSVPSASTPVSIPFPLPTSFFVLGVLAWFVTIASALRSRKLLLFELPWSAAFVSGAVLGLLPKPPLTMGQVWMLQQDNVGEAGPAAQAFGLELKNFRQGIREYL